MEPIDLSELDGDEVRVLRLIADRLRHGKKLYGQLQVGTDVRDWSKEAGEEHADLLVYLTCKEIAKLG
jgi:hypothetical protein